MSYYFQSGRVYFSFSEHDIHFKFRKENKNLEQHGETLLIKVSVNHDWRALSLAKHGFPFFDRVWEAWPATPSTWSGRVVLNKATSSTSSLNMNCPENT